VQLAATLQSLSLTCRNVERASIDAMQKVALELSQQGPYHLEMLRYLDHMPPSAPKWLSPESNRVWMLAKLDELLAILAVSANRQSVPLVDMLRRQYRVLISPLADSVELTEHMLRTAAQVPSQEGPIRYEPFRPLLNLYLELHERFKRFETEIPCDALSAIEFQMSLLTKTLPADFQKALRRMEHDLDRLLHSRSGKLVTRLYARGYHAVLWH
jgi:hypothetical protein